MEPGLEVLEKRLGEVYDLRYAASLLRWDEATYMPPGGAVARGRQLATLDRLAHERLTDPAMRELLEGVPSKGRSTACDGSLPGASGRVVAKIDPLARWTFRERR